MLIVGLTGGIASGKSTASREFRAQGVAVIDADQIARQVLEPGEVSYALVVQHFGREILDSSGRIDRAQLGHVIFSDTTKRQQLNRCTHPYIRRRILWHVLRLYLTGHAMCVLDVPLLFESGLDRVCARTIAIECTREQQIERLEQRNELGRAEAEARIDAQMSSGERAKRATRVVDNAGAEQQLVKQIAGLVCEWRPGVVRTALALAAPVGAVAGLAFVNTTWGLGSFCAAAAWMVSSLFW
ncbi:Dephospho-CoA kinase [Coemansia erecta]|nr:Dephospho-CoA kinase [Coemansia erecta]